MTSIPPLCILHTEDEEDEDEEEEERKKRSYKKRKHFLQRRDKMGGNGRKEREKGGRGAGRREGEGRTYADLVGLQRSRSVCEGHELGFLGHSSPAIDGLLFSSSHDAKQIKLGGVGFRVTEWV